MGHAGGETFGSWEEEVGWQGFVGFEGVGGSGEAFGWCEAGGFGE